MITLIVAALSGSTMLATGIQVIIAARKPAGPRNRQDCLSNGEVPA